MLARVKSGEIRTFRLSIEIIELDGEPCLLIATNDITERKQVEEALRQSEERYRTIIDNIEDGYWEIDLKGNIIFFNDCLLKIHQRSRQELLNQGYKQHVDAKTAQRL